MNLSLSGSRVSPLWSFFVDARYITEGNIKQLVLLVLLVDTKTGDALSYSPCARPRAIACADVRAPAYVYRWVIEVTFVKIKRRLKLGAVYKPNRS